MATYGLDLAYKVEGEIGVNTDVEESIRYYLGSSSSSGCGWGLRDMQWEGMSQETVGATVTVLTKHVSKIPEVAYISLYQETDGEMGLDENNQIFHYEAAWYEAESRKDHN